ncbi:uncharacterized protein GGS22DRAFT_191983 [Annulohypoxylon maeteangense]|uniref:uncharacterized protein n=1 Tax=Annulohypoxylon maeteangense TaxID=1927788 RepID=UPI00200826F1|nr:uncharacterized protein GGS22DRAFT_191983 [Annulohypoxylon maeteangense]KAI0881791.1 hypothetical protein GGS22DRAFT_191983 [Annulohypoxylon maeteangense]
MESSESSESTKSTKSTESREESIGLDGFKKLSRALSVSSWATKVRQELSSDSSDPCDRINSPKSPPSVYTEDDESIPDEDEILGDLIYGLFSAVLDRYPTYTIPELRQHLEKIFTDVASHVENELPSKLGLSKKLDVEYKLVGRYPYSVTTETGASVSPCISFTVPNDYRDWKHLVLNKKRRKRKEVADHICTTAWEIVRDYQKTKRRKGVSWTDILVIELNFEAIDDKHKAFRYNTVTDMVFLLTGDRENCVLHDTLVPEESKAIGFATLD